MKQIVVVALCLVCIFGVLGSASAQDHGARATVPFGFYVANTWVPAGTYTLSSDSLSPNVIVIRAKDRKFAMFSLTQPDGEHSTSDVLRFAKIGDQYFLHEILCSTCRMNVQFPGSKREKQARIREASIVKAPDVVVALN